MKTISTLLLATLLTLTGFTQIPTDGLVAWYPFNGNANDESGNGNHGTVNGATLTTDRFGNSNCAYNFDGVNDFISRNSLLNGYDSSSLSFWVYSNSNCQLWAPIVADGDGSGGINGYGVVQSCHALNTVTYPCNGCGNYFNVMLFGGWYNCTNSTTIVPFLTWSYVTLIKKHHSWSLYMNANLIGTGGPSVPYMPNGYFYIGGTPTNTLFYNGDIDDIRIYNRALTQFEITALYNESPCTSLPPTIQNVSNCGPGSVTLIASGGTTYNWYNTATGGSIIGTGATFITPYLTVSDTFWVSNMDGCESERVPVIVTLDPGNSVSGTLTYDNTASTPLSCCTVYLKTNADVLVDSTETDLNGNYSFTCVSDGSYFLTAVSNKEVGGINSIDALQALQHFTGYITLTGLRYLACDVNANGFINSADALLIAKRYTGAISTLLAGDWIFQGPSVTVAGNNQYTFDFKGLCVGDVNGSYIPPINCFKVCGDILVDDRDGQEYPTVQIGSQCWMQKNLNIGTMVISDSTNIIHSNCSNNNLIEKFCLNNDPVKCTMYGGFYDWYEMMKYNLTPGSEGICPQGWILPSDLDWCNLTIFLDYTVNCNVYAWNGTNAGGKLKVVDTSWWESPNIGATNESGFSAIGAGYRSGYGYFGGTNQFNYFWTSSVYSSASGIVRRINYDHADIARFTYPKEDGFSVRCIKN